MIVKENPNSLASKLVQAAIDGNEDAKRLVVRLVGTAKFVADDESAGLTNGDAELVRDIVQS